MSTMPQDPQTEGFDQPRNPLSISSFASLDKMSDALDRMTESYLERLSELTSALATTKDDQEYSLLAMEFKKVELAVVLLRKSGIHFAQVALSELEAEKNLAGYLRNVLSPEDLEMYGGGFHKEANAQNANSRLDNLTPRSARSARRFSGGSGSRRLTRSQRAQLGLELGNSLEDPVSRPGSSPENSPTSSRVLSQPLASRSLPDIRESSQAESDVLSVQDNDSDRPAVEVPARSESPETRSPVNHLDTSTSSPLSSVGPLDLSEIGSDFDVDDLPQPNASSTPARPKFLLPTSPKTPVRLSGYGSDIASSNSANATVRQIQLRSGKRGANDDVFTEPAPRTRKSARLAEGAGTNNKNEMLGKSIGDRQQRSTDPKGNSRITRSAVLTGQQNNADRADQTTPSTRRTRASVTANNDSTERPTQRALRSAAQPTKFVEAPITPHSSRRSSKPARKESSQMPSSVTKPAAKVTKPSEPLYCYCHKPSEGEMIACDNRDCPNEWFHFKCAKIKEVPKRRWLCSDCMKLPKYSRFVK